MRTAWFFAPAAGLLLGSAVPPPSVTLDYAVFPEALPGCGLEWRADCGDLAGADRASTPIPIPAAASKPVAATVPGPKPAKWATRRQEPLRVVVSIPQQRAYVYEGSRLLESSRVSTGRRGHETPLGTFRIMEKKVKHRSNRYANAPMPYMQRLTSYGIALHAGHLPGYPASHGCIRLPWGFARRLFDLTDSSTIVTVTNRRQKPSSVRPG